MSQLIDIPGNGTVEFPDGMNDEQITSAIHSNFPELKPPAPVTQLSPVPSLRESLAPIIDAATATAEAHVDLLAGASREQAYPASRIGDIPTSQTGQAATINLNTGEYHVEPDPIFPGTEQPSATPSTVAQASQTPAELLAGQAINPLGSAGAQLAGITTVAAAGNPLFPWLSIPQPSNEAIQQNVQQHLQKQQDRKLADEMLVGPGFDNRLAAEGELHTPTSQERFIMAKEKVRRAFTGLFGPTQAQVAEEGIPIRDDSGNVTLQYKPLGNTFEQKGFVPTMQEPLVHVERLAPNPDDSALTVLGKSTYNAVAGLSEGLTSPIGILTAGIASAPAAIQRGVSAAFAAQMAHGAYEGAQQALNGATAQDKIEGGLNAIVSLAFAYGSASHALHGKPGALTHEDIAQNLDAVPDHYLQVAGADADFQKSSPDLHAAITAELARRNLQPVSAENLVQSQRAADAEPAPTEPLAPETQPAGNVEPVAMPVEQQGARAQAFDVNNPVVEDREAHPDAEAASASAFAKKPLIRLNKGDVKDAAMIIRNTDPSRPPVKLVENPETAGYVIGKDGQEHTPELDFATPEEAVRAAIARGFDVDERIVPKESQLRDTERSHQVSGESEGQTRPGGSGIAPAIESEAGAAEAAKPEEVAAAPAQKLQPGQKQGDLLGGSEDLTLVGEKVGERPPTKSNQLSVQDTVADAVRAYGDIPTALQKLQDQIDHPDTSAADRTRLNAASRHMEAILEDESRREQAAEREQAMTGKYELIQSVKDLGGLPSQGSKHHAAAAGELRHLMEAKKGAFLTLFRKDARSLDTLRGDLNERGFDFETPEDMLSAIEDSLATGKKRMGEKAMSEGPGAAAVTEFPEQGKVGAYNAKVDERRAARGLEPLMSKAREANPDTWDRAVERIEKDPGHPEQLVEEILSGEKKSISRDEQAELLWRMTDLRNKLEMEDARAASEHSTEEEGYDAQAKAEHIEKQLQRTEEADRAAGSTSGAALQFRQVLANEDYTFGGLMRKARKANKGPLSAEERATIRQQAKDIETLQKKMDEAIDLSEKQQREAEIARMHEATIKELREQIDKQPKYSPLVFEHARKVVAALETRADAARVRLRARMGRTSAGVDPGIVVDVAEIMAAKVARFGLEKGEVFSSMIAEGWGDFRDHFEKGWKAMGKLLEKDLAVNPPKVKEVVKAGVEKVKAKGEKTPVDIKARAKAEAVAGEDLSHKTVYEMARAHVRGELAKGNEARGVEGSDAMFKAVHADLKEYYPDLTIEDVQKAYTEYGKVKFPSKEADKVRLAEYREIGQLQQKIADLEAGKSPLHTGLQRAQRTQDVRLLTARLNELLKKYTGEPSPEKLASRNQAKVTALRNQIEDLDRQLQTGEKPIARAAMPDTPEIERLKAERGAMKTKLDEIEAAVSPPKSEAEIQVEQLAKARDKVSKTLAGEVDPKTQKPFVALSQAAEDIKAEILAMRQLAADMRKEVAQPGRAAKADAAEIKRYEDAIKRYEEKTAKADFLTQTRTPNAPRTAQAAQLKAILEARKAVYEAAKKASKPVKSAEQIYNERRAKDIARQTAEVNARIASGNYAKAPKKAMPQLSPENVKAYTELQAKKRESQQYAEQFEKANRTPAQKLIDRVIKVPWQLATAVKVVGHGTVGMITHAGGLLWRPTKALIYWRNFGRQFGMWTNKAYHDRLIYNLENHPRYNFWKDAGASIEPYKTYTDYGLYAKWLGKLTAGGQRGFDALKLTRLEMNEADWKSVPVEIKVDPVAARETTARIAEINNKATGAVAKGDTMLGALARHPLMNAAFFAPKLYATRWTRVVLDPIKTTATFYDMASDRVFGTSKVSKADAYAATTKLKHAAEFAATYVGALLVNQAILSATGSSQQVNLKDPTKKDWLKFKAGGKEVLADGGLLDPLRLIGQVVVGDLMMERSKQEEFKQGTRFQKAGGDILNYLRGKANPSLGLVVDASTGSDYTGRPLPFSIPHIIAKTPLEKGTQFKPKYEWGEWLIKQGPIPISGGVQVAYDEMRKKGLSDLQARDIINGSAVAAFGMTGAHVSEEHKPSVSPAPARPAGGRRKSFLPPALAPAK